MEEGKEASGVERRIKVDLNFEEPLIDHKINGKSWIVKMRIGDYMDMMSTDTNKYQRNLQSLSFYKKLIQDLLDDTTMPPISVVYPEKDIDFSVGLNPQKKFIILDGLQRTNCISTCLKMIEDGKSEGKFKKIEDFKNKKIYVEIWEELDLKYILYKMVVLNTGQKKMDYDHQLDILSESVENKLQESNVTYITKKEETKGIKKENAFKLSAITSGLVSFVNGAPIPGKKNAAEFLFERFNISMEGNEEKNALSVIFDDETYKYVEWVLKDFNTALQEKYGQHNPLVNYEVFMTSLFASLGYAYQRNPEQLHTKVEQLMGKFETSSDPLRIKVFDEIYSSFKTGIGTKRRKFIFETFKYYFVMSSADEFEWEQIKDDLGY
ncbi:hypothetical protein COL22_02145 [Bacillus thuringiensis]|uniref:hypothetical protein n=1 Tax=Bacillus thuringiensis TaxID=1428 RepID=UPI000BF7F0CB|nr:hypothetical protein [Bacillus thuringiensis]PFW16461.1 hypothetical protein COL22_02145 [Bacillus thuringiensis]